MKELTIGTQSVPAPHISVGESVNALTEQVNNLQRKYYRALLPTAKSRPKLTNGISVPSAGRAPAWCFPPLVIAVALCVYKQRSAGKGVRYERDLDYENRSCQQANGAKNQYTNLECQSSDITLEELKNLAKFLNEYIEKEEKGGSNERGRKE